MFFATSFSQVFLVKLIILTVVVSSSVETGLKSSRWSGGPGGESSHAVLLHFDHLSSPAPHIVMETQPGRSPEGSRS